MIDTLNVDTLKVKAEKVLHHILSQEIELQELQVVRGHFSDTPSLPMMAVYSPGYAPNEEMPDIVGVRNVMLRIRIEAVYRDHDYQQVSSWMRHAESLLRNLPKLQERANAPISGPDLRPVRHFHLYDALTGPDESGFDEDLWIEEQEYMLVCSQESTT